MIQFAGLWFVNGKFSASWKLVQAVVQKPKAQLQGQCHIKLKPQDKEKLKTQTVKDDDVECEPVQVTSIVCDSDDEVEEEEEEIEETVVVAPPPPPPVVVEEPKVVKKRVVKKKTEV